MRKYYYLADQDRVGPLTLEEMRLVEGLTPETLVWCEGMPEWLPAGELPELSVIFMPPPPPPPSSAVPPPPILLLLPPPKPLSFEERILRGLKYGIVLIVLLISTLSFHFVFNKWLFPDIFPKEHLTFTNTFVTQSDINKLIRRYNDSSPLERVASKQAPLFKKLMEKGYIIEPPEGEGEMYTKEDYNRPDTKRLLELKKKRALR
jgi:hypothetical protein